MRYEIVRFVPIPLCNTFSMHLLKTYDKNQSVLEKLHVLITNINGVVHFIDGSVNNVRKDLKEVLDEGSMEDFSLELVCSDISSYGLDEDGDVFAHIVTCWVFYDNLFCPRRFMVAFFRVYKDFTFERCNKFDIPFAPTMARVQIKDGKHFFLVFGHSRNVRCFGLEAGTELKLSSVEDFESFFPALCASNIYGSLTRSDQLTTENYQFDLMGFDTGHLVATVCSSNESVMLDRKAIKFNTPISIALFINLGCLDQDLYVVASSTIGPAAIWALFFDQVKHKIKLELRCQLLESDRHDCVVSAAICGDTILVGTYGEQLLFYPIKDALCCSEVLPINQLNVGAPILAVAPFDIDESLLVLSSKGIQQYTYVDSDTLTDNQSTNIVPSSTSSSPITAQNTTSD